MMGKLGTARIQVRTEGKWVSVTSLAVREGVQVVKELVVAESGLLLSRRFEEELAPPPVSLEAELTNVVVHSDRHALIVRTGRGDLDDVWIYPAGRWPVLGLSGKNSPV